MITTTGGVRIAWGATGHGPPLLLVHGLGYARWGWEPLVPLLAERHRVITFDNRGIGESSVPAGPYTAAGMATDALAVLDAAGVDRAHVAGTSLGGMIAQELAIDHPDRVDRLVLLSTTPGATGGYPMPEETVRLLSEAASLPPVVALRRFVENALGEDPDEALVERIVARRLASPPDPDGWAAQADAGTRYDGAGRAAAITVPTLVITGEADRVVDPRNADVLGNVIPGAIVQRIPGAGHLPFWEQPRLVADLMLRHLA